MNTNQEFFKTNNKRNGKNKTSRFWLSKDPVDGFAHMADLASRAKHRARLQQFIIDTQEY